MARALAHINV